jgi:TolA-binding protein
MNCREVEEQDILERYTLDRLTDSERDAFEQHYFECDSCFEQVQTELAIHNELRSFPRTKERRSFFGQARIWVPASAILAALFAAGAWWYTGRMPHVEQAVTPPAVTSPPASLAQPSTAAPSLDELARVEAPPYSEVVLRGVEDEAQTSFRSAMQRYVKQDYTGAIPGLRAAVRTSPQSAQFNFYLGACYLLTGQTEAAVQSLRRTISLNDPAYSEAAHFYLAKAYLRNHYVSRAETELRTAARPGGSKAVEAAEILRQLGK